MDEQDGKSIFPLFDVNVPTPSGTSVAPEQSIMTFNSQTAEWLTFHPCGLKISLKTGEVIIPEGLSLDKASREFWLRLRQYYGG